MNGNTIAFTDWYMVIINSKNKNMEIPVPKFLKELEKKINSSDYNVFYNDKKKCFIITYDGDDYTVVLNQKEQNELANKNYTPLILKLMLLASLEKKASDEMASQAVKKQKLKAIIESDYENIESLEDYELYLEYLKESLQKAKSIEDKNTINTKIACILSIIERMKKEEKEKEDNPLDLKLHINRFVYNILRQIDKLDDKNKKIIALELKRILIDYKQIVDDYNSRNDTSMIIGNPMVPMEILERIIDVEYKLKVLLKNRELSSFVDTKLNSIEDELAEVINNKKGKK